ncbi:MAG: hypothetical protein HZC25_17255 [Rhodospirillales bacterium]|nr:hypothetical protein [Rhodospirillales bacterium]
MAAIVSTIGVVVLVPKPRAAAGGLAFKAPKERDAAIEPKAVPPNAPTLPKGAGVGATAAAAKLPVSERRKRPKPPPEPLAGLLVEPELELEPEAPFAVEKVETVGAALVVSGVPPIVVTKPSLTTAP